MSDAPAKVTGFKAWMQLIRMPNFFSLPGDVLLGIALSGIALGDCALAFIVALAISCALYGAGMILNDLFDYAEDSKERPERPLPSGAVSRKSALIVSLLLIAAALAGSWLFNQALFYTTIALTAAILLYDGPARKIPKLGFVVMGSCRFFNIGLGLAAGAGGFDQLQRPDLLFTLMSVELFYIVAVCVIAHNETKGLPSRMWCLMPAIVVCAGIATWIQKNQPLTANAIIGSLIAAVPIWHLVWQLKPGMEAKKIPPFIGKLIKSLIFIQAGYIIMTSPNYFIPALVLLLAVPVVSSLARKYYMS